MPLDGSPFGAVVHRCGAGGSTLITAIDGRGARQALYMPSRGAQHRKKVAFCFLRRNSTSSTTTTQ